MTSEIILNQEIQFLLKDYYFKLTEYFVCRWAMDLELETCVLARVFAEVNSAMNLLLHVGQHQFIVEKCYRSAFECARQSFKLQINHLTSFSVWFFLKIGWWGSPTRTIRIASFALKNRWIRVHDKVNILWELDGCSLSDSMCHFKFGFLHFFKIYIYTNLMAVGNFLIKVFFV